MAQRDCKFLFFTCLKVLFASPVDYFHIPVPTTQLNSTIGKRIIPLTNVLNQPEKVDFRTKNSYLDSKSLPHTTLWDRGGKMLCNKCHRFYQTTLFIVELLAGKASDVSTHELLRKQAEGAWILCVFRHGTINLPSKQINKLRKCSPPYPRQVSNLYTTTATSLKNSFQMPSSRVH